MYKLYMVAIALFISAWSTVLTANQPLRNAFHTPDISNNWVSFSYDGNIWLVPRQGGLAHQLTNQSGASSNGKFSPDGSSIAYSMRIQDNSDVFVIPTAGGISKRITYHPEHDYIVDWHPVDDQLLIKSTRESFRYRFNQFFHISPKGGLAEKLPLIYAETGSYCSDGKKLAYTYTNDFQDGNETWKRYKGGRAPDIWLYDVQKQTVEAITEYTGIDMSPMCIGDDIYFLSDRGDEERSNLWVYRVQNKLFEQITHFTDNDIRHPSADRDAIVFENEGFLYVYEVAERDLKKLDIQISAQQKNMSAYAAPLVDNIQDARLSPDGANIYISARGEILSYHIKDKVLKNLTQTPGVAERFPSISTDGSLAYMSDSDDEYQLFTRSKSGNTKKHTNYVDGFNFRPYWSPDRRHLVFMDEKQQIHLLSTKSNRDKIIGRTMWKSYHALKAMKFSWSPDGDWLLFTMANKNRNQAVFLYELKAQRLHQISSGYYNDQEAIFCANGAFICLLSQREFNPVYGDVDSTWTYSNSSALYLMPLQSATKSPYRGNSEQAHEWQGIDYLELENHLIKIPVKHGQIESIHAAEGQLIYHRRSAEGTQSIYSLSIESGEEQQLLANAKILDVSANGQLLALQDGSYQLVSLSKPEAIDDVDFADYTIHVDPDQEKYQVLRDAWRFYRDFYYDPDLHGRNWNEEWERYAKLIESAHSNEDINRIVRELGGELEGGHVWATATAARVRWKNSTVGLLGIDLENVDGSYRITKVYSPAAWLPEDRSPLAEPGLPKVEGKFLLAINNIALRPDQSPWQALEGQLDKWVELQLSDTADGKRTQILKVKTIQSERHMREMEWVEANRRYVELKTAGRVGYIYVPDTGRNGQTALMRQYQAQYHMEALIVDARFNAGGALGDRLVELLNRPPLNYFSTRNARDSQLPELANGGPKILVTNGWSYSGGDGFPFLFQQAGVGPVLGERTWGGLIGPGQPIPLLNGGAVSPPPQRVYDRDGNWGTGGDIGVTPDILVKNLPGDLLKGIDAQLDRAIEWTLQQLGSQKPAVVPPIPREG